MPIGHFSGYSLRNNDDEEKKKRESLISSPYSGVGNFSGYAIESKKKEPRKDDITPEVFQQEDKREGIFSRIKKFISSPFGKGEDSPFKRVRESIPETSKYLNLDVSKDVQFDEQGNPVANENFNIYDERKIPDRIPGTDIGYSELMITVEREKKSVRDEIAERQVKGELEQVKELQRDLDALDRLSDHPETDIGYFNYILQESRADRIDSDYEEPGVLGGAIESLKQGTYQMLASIGAGVELAGKKTNVDYLIKKGQEANEHFEQVLNDNPEWEVPTDIGKWEDPRFYGRLIGGVVPSMLGSYAVAITVAGVAAAASAPAAVAAGVGLIAAFGYSALSEGGSAYDEAKKYGASDEMAENAGVLVGVINGAIELLPIFKFLNRTPVVDQTKDQLIKTTFRNIITQAASEGTEEFTQEIVNNAVAQTYDDERELFDNTLESFVGGLLAGGIAETGGVTSDLLRGGNLKPESQVIKDRNIAEKTKGTVIPDVVQQEFNQRGDGRAVTEVTIEQQLETANKILDEMGGKGSVTAQQAEEFVSLPVIGEAIDKTLADMKTSEQKNDFLTRADQAIQEGDLRGIVTALAKNLPEQIKSKFDQVILKADSKGTEDTNVQIEFYRGEGGLGQELTAEARQNGGGDVFGNGIYVAEGENAEQQAKRFGTPTKGSISVQANEILEVSTQEQYDELVRKALEAYPNEDTQTSLPKYIQGQGYKVVRAVKEFQDQSDAGTVIYDDGLINKDSGKTSENKLFEVAQSYDTAFDLKNALSEVTEGEEGNRTPIQEIKYRSQLDSNDPNYIDPNQLWQDANDQIRNESPIPEDFRELGEEVLQYDTVDAYVQALSNQGRLQQTDSQLQRYGISDVRSFYDYINGLVEPKTDTTTLEDAGLTELQQKDLLVEISENVKEYAGIAENSESYNQFREAVINRDDYKSSVKNLIAEGFPTLQDFYRTIKTQQNSPDITKAAVQTREQMVNETVNFIKLRISESDAGYRFQKQDGTFDGTPSTFPQWLPESLRKKSVLETIDTKGTVANDAARALAEDVLLNGIREENIPPREDFRLILEEINTRSLQESLQQQQEAETERQKEPEVKQTGFKKQSAPGVYADYGGFSSIESAREQTKNIPIIEFPEMIKIARELLPGDIKLEKARTTGKGTRLGYFSPSKGEIGLSYGLFKNPDEAASVLAHEIGHLADYLPDGTMRRGRFVNRITSLVNATREEFKALGLDKERVYIDELKNLSQIWKPFDENADIAYTSYRYSGEELYADAISVLFNNPQLLKDTAPRFWDSFFDFLDRKPDVKTSLFDTYALLRQGRGALLSERYQGIFDMFQKAEDQWAVLREDQQKQSDNVIFHIKRELVDRNAKIIQRIQKAQKDGAVIPADENPQYALEELNYVGGKQKAWMEEYVAPIQKQLKDAGVSWEDFGAYLFLNRIVNERGEAQNPTTYLRGVLGETWDQLGLNKMLPEDIAELSRTEQIKALKNTPIWSQLQSLLPGIANPQGFTGKDAQEQLDSMRELLGDEKFNTVSSVAEEYFRKGTQELLNQGEEVGLFDANLVSELKANPAYATFQVVDYLDLRIDPGIKQQRGTLKDIANPATATIMKNISLISAIERQRAKSSVVDFLLKNDSENITEAKTRFDANRKEQVPIESRNKDEALITLMKDGKRVGYYVDPYIAKSFEIMDSGTMRGVMGIVNWFNNAAPRPLFITFNLGFQSFNFMRDFVRTVKAYPDRSLVRSFAKVTRGYFNAIKPALARGFDKPNDVIREMEKNEILSLTYNDIIKGEDSEAKQIDVVTQKFGINKRKPKTNPLLKPIVNALSVIENTGNTIETLPKVAAYQELVGTMPSKELASFIRTAVGSPDFLKKGSAYPVSNNLFLFSNAIIQGVRADYNTAFTNPRTRVGYWWKTAWLTFLPKTIMFAGLAGALGEGIKKMFEDATEYDKTNYTIIPIGRENDKTIYLRIPQDETGRLLGGIYWKMLRALSEDPDFSDVLDIASYTGGQLPSPSPLLTMIQQTSQFLAGENPYDYFRGREIIPQKEFNAGGKYALKPFLIFQLQQLGGNIVFGSYITEQSPETKTWYQKVLEAPILSNIIGRWIRVTNYGQQEKNRSVVDEQRQQAAIEGLQEDYLVQEYVDRYNAEGVKSSTLRTKILNELIEESIGKNRSAVSLTSEEKSTVTSLRRKFNLAILRGSNDPNIQSLLKAQTNKEKAAILKEISKDMNKNDFEKLYKYALQEGVISEDVIKKYRAL